MAATYEELLLKSRELHASGDIEGAKRLAKIAISRRGTTQPQPEQPAQSQPSPMMATPMPENAQLHLRGPGPTGGGLQELYDANILPRRYVEGQPQQAAAVTAADGTEMVLNPGTGQMTSRELMAGNMTPSTGQSFQAGAAQGITMGLGDEVAGVVSGPFMREKIRAATDAASRDHPIATGAGEIGGALSLPVAKFGPTGTLKEAVVTGAKAGATYGGTYAAAMSSGGAVERLKDGLEGAVGGALFGAAIPVVVNFGTKAFRRAFKASSERPSIESLRTAKSIAYKAVDDSGETFAAAEMQGLADKVKSGLASTNYVQGVDRQTDAVVTLLEAKAGAPMTIGQLDKLRQNFYKRFSAASNETGILDAIDAIDDLILSRSSTSGLLDAARMANARYKKAEVLDLAFQKARDQTSATGSGGNILNKYRQAVTAIITNPKRAKWFNAEEVAAMRAFVEGTPSQNTLRLIGKLAPNGNGLMTALNLGAVASNPAMLGVTALSSGAKALSDGAVERGAQALIGKVSGGGAKPAPRPINYPQRLNALAGPLAN